MNVRERIFKRLCLADKICEIKGKNDLSYDHRNKINLPSLSDFKTYIMKMHLISIKNFKMKKSYTRWKGHLSLMPKNWSTQKTINNKSVRMSCCI